MAELLIIECNKHQLCQPRQWFGSVLHVRSKYEFRPVTKYVARLTSGKRILNIDSHTILANLNAAFYEVLSLKLRDNGQDASPFAICHCFYVRYCAHLQGVLVFSPFLVLAKKKHRSSRASALRADGNGCIRHLLLTYRISPTP